jgi:G3E family GTPase/ankyrin repeat protein
MTPLHTAAAAKCPDLLVFKALLESDPGSRNVADESGRTPLFYACEGGHAAVVEALTSAGVEIEAQDHDGLTPLCIASSNGHAAVVQELVVGGAEPNHKPKDGSAPIFLASRNGHHAVVETLLAGGADHSAKNNNGSTPLLTASSNGHIHVVVALLTAGAKPNQISNDEMMRPLHLASVHGHAACVEALLANGADKKAIDTQGRTALEFAAQSGHEDVVSILENAGNKGIQDAHKTPVTIITGFLGAGKTTLINYVLTERHGMRIAVVENEFGAVSVDDKLGIAEKLESKEHLIMLDNGCACCTVRGDLVNTFVELAQLPVPFEAIIVELSGMADPAPVAYTFTNTEISADFRVDSIVCVVDSKHISQHLHDDSRGENDVNEAVQQVAFADRILLNKIDLVTAAEKQTVIDELKSINSFARTIECQQSSVPLKDILGVSSFTLDQATMLEAEFEYIKRDVYLGATAAEDLFQAAAAATAAGRSVEDATGSVGTSMDVVRKNGKSHQFGGVTSIAIKLTADLHCPRFSAFMSRWLFEHAESLYRSKGICCMAGRDVKYVFQGVHDNVQCSPSETKWPEGEARGTTLVFIGRNLDKDVLRDELQKTCMQEGEAVPEWDDENPNPEMEEDPAMMKLAVEALSSEALSASAVEFDIPVLTEEGTERSKEALRHDLFEALQKQAHDHDHHGHHGHHHGHHDGHGHGHEGHEAAEHDVSEEICNNYIAGKCRFGEECRRKHEGDIPQDNIEKRPKKTRKPRAPKDDNADVSGEVCKNYLAGKCRFGAECRRIHEGDVAQDNIVEKPKRARGAKREPRDPDADVSGEVCKNYLAGKCRLGENCRRIHQGDVEQLPVEKLDEVCNNFKEGNCRFGDNCRRRHE